MTRLLWFPVKGGLGVYFQQGLAMGLVVLLVGLLVAGVSSALSPLVGVVVLFALAAPVYGLAGLWIADLFRLPAVRPPITPAGPWSPARPIATAPSRTGTLQRHVLCPTCGTEYDVIPGGMTHCPKDGEPLGPATEAG